MESQKQQRKHQHRMQLRIPIEKRTKVNLPSTQTHDTVHQEFHSHTRQNESDHRIVYKTNSICTCALYVSYLF